MIYFASRGEAFDLTSPYDYGKKTFTGVPQ